MSQMVYSIKTELQNKLLKEMIGEVKGKLGKGEFMLLVVDKRTSQILSSCARMYDLMQTDVMILERLNLGREKLNFHGIYFIENTMSSIKHLLNDYVEGKKKKGQYKAVHLFFTGRVTEQQMELIQSRKKLVDRIETFKELNVDFLSFESRVFSFNHPCRTISNVYLSGVESKKQKVLETISNQLISLCLTLKENPYIRYWSTSKAKAEGGDLCKNVAKIFEKEFKKKTEEMKDWQRDETRSRGTLLIVDRSIDPAAPLMHEFTYQAMVQDLLNVKGECCTLPGSEKKANENKVVQDAKDEKKDIELDEGKKEEEEDNIVVLSENDELWNEMRHQHISAVMENVPKKLKEFKAANAMASYQANRNDEKRGNLKGMVDGVKAIAQYKERMQMFDKHIRVSKECYNFFDTKSLKGLGDLEQDMATGLTEDCEEVQVKEVKKNLVKECQSPKISVIDKLRLLMIYMISQGSIQQGTLSELMKTIDDSLKKALYNLAELGVDISDPKDRNNTPKLTPERKEEFEKQNRAAKLTLMRYAPALQSVMTQLVNWELSEKDFPYIEEPPKEEKKNKIGLTQTKTWRRNKKEQKDERPLFIIFVLGGMTYSEMRLIYSDPHLEKMKIIIGSTDILNPRRYIRGLAKLSDKEFVKSVKNSEGNAESDHLIEAEKEASDVEEKEPNLEEGKEEIVVQPQEEEEDFCPCLSFLDHHCACLDNWCKWLDKYL